jgi:hypothetical protein
MKTSWLTGVTVLSMCTACIPVAKLTSYEPQMDNARVRTDKCIGWKSLEYQVGDALLTASVERWPHVQHTYPSLRLLVKSPRVGKTELAGTSIAVVSPHLQEPVQLPITGLVARNAKSYDYRLDTSLAALPEGDLRIQLPDLIVNGQRHPIPAMQFKHKLQALTMLPLNC